MSDRQPINRAKQLSEICRAIERGQVTMTNGPFLEVKAMAGDAEAGPGEDLLARDGQVELTIRVQCSNWLDVNRVQVFINGREAEVHNYRRSRHGEMFGSGVVKFNATVSFALEQDAHLIVAAAGEGRQLGAIYGEEQGKVMPVAVSNPIFVDLNGDGFEANGDDLGIPLPVEADHQPTHGHTHPRQFESAADVEP